MPKTDTPEIHPLPFSHRAKKSLGQNFLHDRNVARKIVDQLSVSAHDRVLEIGPGPGSLTSLLLMAAPAFLGVLEMDNNWSRELKRQWPRLGVVQTDALRFDWSRLAPDGAGRGWKLIGNLPYNVASPIMWDALSLTPCLERAVFMVQKEVALRLTAIPGTKAYGALSAWVQSFVRPELAFVVRPGVFIPKPKIDSAVVCFQQHPISPTAFDPRALAGLLKLCFQKRRKQLRGILKDFWTEEVEAVLGAHDLAPTCRPENLSPQAFQALGNVLKNRFVS